MPGRRAVVRCIVDAGPAPAPPGVGHRAGRGAHDLRGRASSPALRAAPTASSPSDRLTSITPPAGRPCSDRAGTCSSPPVASTARTRRWPPTRTATLAHGVALAFHVRRQPPAWRSAAAQGPGADPATVGAAPSPPAVPSRSAPPAPRARARSPGPSDASTAPRGAITSTLASGPGEGTCTRTCHSPGRWSTSSGSKACSTTVPSRVVRRSRCDPPGAVATAPRTARTGASWPLPRVTKPLTCSISPPCTANAAPGSRSRKACTPAALYSGLGPSAPPAYGYDGSVPVAPPQGACRRLKLWPSSWIMVRRQLVRVASQPSELSAGHAEPIVLT